jgi:hypothetical protein
MTTEVIRAEFLQEAFRAAVLLTGNLKQAEEAVLEGDSVAEQRGRARSLAKGHHCCG